MSASPRCRLTGSAILLATILSLAPSIQAQCLDWPGGCPTLAELVILDPGNDPVGPAPGHTPRLKRVCLLSQSTTGFSSI